jgi:histidinol-phosphate aminotransferase
MTDDPRLTPLAACLPATVPFTGPETLERRMGHPFAARLGANESGWGPSPRAIAAMQAAVPDLWRYGDPEMHDLRAAIASHHATSPAHVMPGEGIDGLLGLIVRLTISPGDVAVMSQGAYPTFAFHVTGFGGRLQTVPYAGHHEDPDALLACARETGAKLLYLCNPDNPMGSWHDAATILRLVGALPAGTLLVLDEAYADFAPAGSIPDIDPADPRIIRLRTFSKAHGLAGLRVGHAIGPGAFLAAFDRVRNHFGLGRVAQAGALAALEDRTWLADVVARTAQARARLAAIARANGLDPVPSATSFVTMDCASATIATATLHALAARGIFIRKPAVPPLDRCIRVTAAPEPGLDAFARALPEALAAARAAADGAGTGRA